MKKTIYIEGMMCMHCAGRVEKALNDLPGVTATVDLDGKLAGMSKAYKKAITTAE